MHKILVLTRDQEEYKRKLLALNLPDAELIVPDKDNPEEIEAAASKTDIWFANPLMACKWINKAEKLVWYQSTYVGIDAMNEPSLRKDYKLTNVKEVYGTAMSEYVLGYILAFEKDLFEYREKEKDSNWDQKPFPTLEGRTLCILGAGSIGREIAKAAKAFNMTVLGYKKSPGEVEYFDGIFTGDEMEDFLKQGDYVVSVLPNTEATNDIINYETLCKMKKSAVFMNIGRGNAVNEEDLIRALNEGKIAKAVLDVFKTEPLPKDHPFWSMKNVFITPHVSGYFLNDRVVEIFEKNYKLFINKEPLLYQVDLEKGY